MTLTIAEAVALVAGTVIPLAALTLAAARFIVSRMDRAEDKNERAHAAITENIRAVDERAERRAEAHRLALEAHRAAIERQGAILEKQGAAIERQGAILERQGAAIERQGATLEAHRAVIERQGATLEAQETTIEAIARDVSFLAGRQAERDARAAGADRGAAP